MPELFLELFSEEIPARMQARAAEDLSRLCGDALAPLAPKELRTWYGPRRIALAAKIAGSVPPSSSTERGPRANAPEQALAGFLRKHGASREQVRQDGDYWVLDKTSDAIPAASLIAEAVPPLLRRFPWPKSMRWGAGSNFLWVRPLRRIVCLLDGAVVPFTLRSTRLAASSGTASPAQTRVHQLRSERPSFPWLLHCEMYRRTARRTAGDLVRQQGQVVRARPGGGPVQRLRRHHGGAV